VFEYSIRDFFEAQKGDNVCLCLLEAGREFGACWVLGVWLLLWFVTGSWTFGVGVCAARFWV